MERRWDSRLDGLGVAIEGPENARYRLVDARWVAPAEAGDKFYVYVRVQDEQGAPLQDHEFRLAWQAEAAEHQVTRTKGPGLDDYYGNVPIYPGLTYAVDIPTAASDKVTGLKRGDASDPTANSCFYLTFQRGAEVTPVPPPQPQPQPEPQPQLDEATRRRLLALLDQAQAEIDAARALLEVK